MKVFHVYPPRYASLNVRSLLRTLFFDEPVAHPDPSRQRKARQRAVDRRAARRLKATYTPWVPKLPVPIPFDYLGRKPVRRSALELGTQLHLLLEDYYGKRSA